MAIIKLECGVRGHREAISLTWWLALENSVPVLQTLTGPDAQVSLGPLAPTPPPPRPQGAICCQVHTCHTLSPAPALPNRDFAGPWGPAQASPLDTWPPPHPALPAPTHLPFLATRPQPLEGDGSAAKLSPRAWGGLCSSSPGDSKEKRREQSISWL